MSEAPGSLQSWVGRTEARADTIGATPARALAATLDRDESGPVPGSGSGFGPGTPLPALWHWLYFLPLTRARDIGPDGHARRGGFLPPVPLPRRMWAGGRLQYRAALAIGDRVERRSTVERVEAKQGRSGELVFVTVRHEFLRAGDALPALTEWHDIVSREPPRPGAAAPAPLPAPAEAAWSRTWHPDDVMLFRYSALTFNGHRIHYDRRYVTEVEGYPGLVVHGPLIATLLLELLQSQRPQALLASFRFDALRPCFDGRPLAVHGRPQDDGGVAGRVVLWACDDAGALAMRAEAVLAPPASPAR
ncbi:MAG: MaoC family dehydratase N-terminal domain-containing protein [Pseudomonadota bacterium]